MVYLLSCSLFVFMLLNFSYIFNSFYILNNLYQYLSPFSDTTF